MSACFGVYEAGEFYNDGGGSGDGFQVVTTTKYLFFRVRPHTAVIPRQRGWKHTSELGFVINHGTEEEELLRPVHTLIWDLVQCGWYPALKKMADMGLFLDPTKSLPILEYLQREFERTGIVVIPEQ